jgi:hypothetical protein
MGRFGKLVRTGCTLAIALVATSVVLVGPAASPAAAQEDPSGPGHWLEVAPFPSNGFRPGPEAYGVRLPDGRLLFPGSGLDEYGDGAGTVIYDPATGYADTGAPMPACRSRAASAVMSDGRVLVVGGSDCGQGAQFANDDTWIYNPASNTWSTVAPIPGGLRANHVAAPLPDGRVLVGGGLLTVDLGDGGILYPPDDNFFVYDSRTNTWSQVDDFPERWASAPMAAPLPGGRVLVTGGRDSRKSFIFEGHGWSGAAALPENLYAAMIAPLGGGRVLVAGGVIDRDPSEDFDFALTTAAHIYDVATDSWSTTAPMPRDRSHGTAVPVSNGSALVTLGVFVSGGPPDTATWIYTEAGAPRAPVLSPTDGATYWYTSVPGAGYFCAPGAGGSLLPGTQGCRLSVDGGPSIPSGSPLPSTLGTHTVEVTAVGADSQRVVHQLAYTVTAGRPPTAAISSPTAFFGGWSFPLGEVPPLEFSCTAGGAPLKAGLAGCSASIDGGPAVPSGTVLAGSVGQHHIVVTATDVIGRQYQTTLDYEETLGRPTVQITTPAPGATYIMGAVPNAAFTCTPAAGGTLRPDILGCFMSIDDGPQLPPGSPLVGSLGTHRMMVVSYDIHGHAGVKQVTYTVGGPGPNAAISHPDDGQVIEHRFAGGFSFSCSPGPGGTLKPGLEGCSARIDGGEPLASGSDLVDIEGLHHIVVTAENVTGQQTTTTHAYTIKADRPIVRLWGPITQTFPVSVDAGDIFMTCTAGGGGTLKPGLAGCYATIDGGAPVADGTPLPNTVGTHDVHAYAVGADGQVQHAFARYTILADAPVASIATPDDGETFAAGAVPTVQFGCAPGPGGTLQAGLNGCSASIDGGPPVASGASLAGALGQHTIVVTARDIDGQGTTVTHDYTVAKGNQTITFGSVPPAGAVVGGTPYELRATASSGLPVTFSIDPAAAAVCSVSSRTVSFTGTGTCVVRANQAGDGSYNPAPQATQTIAVTKVAQSIAFDTEAPTEVVVGGPPHLVGATATSGLEVAFGVDPSSASVCALDVNTVTFTGEGTCVVHADQAGNDTYAAAPRVTQSITVVKVEQSISFDTDLPEDARFGGTHAVGATATSGLPVTFSIDPGASSVCALDGQTVRFTGVGTCVVQADQAGDGTYAAAPRATQSFSVAKAAQSITFDSAAPADARIGGTAYEVAATATSGLAVTYSIDPSAAAVCTLAGQTVSLTGAGTCVVHADQAGDATYDAAPRATQSFAVARRTQSITFGSAAPTAAVYGGPSYQVAATATSGLPVTLSIDPSATSVCSLAGQTVSFTGGGTCVIRADQAGNGTYEAAPPATQSFTVAKATTRLTAVDGRLPFLFGRATFTATLSRADNGPRLAGQRVHFVYRGSVVCSATTSSSGVASCSASVGLLNLFAGGPFTAVYLGDSHHLGTTQQGQL